MGPRDLRGLPPGHAAADADPGDRPAADEPARRGRRASSRTRASARWIPTSRSCATSTSRRPTSPRRSKLAPPSWARTIVPGPRGAPLLYAGTRDGINAAVLAFEPRRSDLPLQVAFPILLANLTGELLGASTAPTEAVEPGTPGRARASPSGAVGLTVTRPDGASTELVPSTTGAGAIAVTYRRHRPARRLHGHPDRRPGSVGRPERVDRTQRESVVRRPQPRPRAAPSASPGASGAPIVDDPLAPVRFVVDLFDVDESNDRPGLRRRRSRRSAPPRRPRPAPAPAASRERVTERPTTRDELWIPIVLLDPRRACASSGRSTTVTAWSGCGAPWPARLGRGAETAT